MMSSAMNTVDAVESRPDSVNGRKFQRRNAAMDRCKTPLQKML
jgi:hypothetical protein